MDELLITPSVAKAYEFQELIMRAGEWKFPPAHKVIKITKD